MAGCDLPGGWAMEGAGLAHSQFRLQGLTFLQVSQGPPVNTAAAMQCHAVQQLCKDVVDNCTFGYRNCLKQRHTLAGPWCHALTTILDILLGAIGLVEASLVTAGSDIPEGKSRG